jgi:2-oxoglutarate dehydrogenase E2 component (dihydrolipoamide succinyltransferase)
MTSPRSRRRSPNWGKRARDGKLDGRNAGRHLHHLERRRLRLADVDADPEPAAVGILGMHKIQERPVVVGGKIVIRPMMYLALSYDHRIVDGKEAVTFLVRVKEALEDPERCCSTSAARVFRTNGLVKRTPYSLC